MTVLRSTNNHYHQQGNTVINVDVTHISAGAIQLLYSWLEIWLFRHCKSGWRIEVSNEDNYRQARQSILSVQFDDVREAVYFKLSPEYLKMHA